MTTAAALGPLPALNKDEMDAIEAATDADRASALVAAVRKRLCFQMVGYQWTPNVPLRYVSPTLEADYMQTALRNMYHQVNREPAVPAAGLDSDAWDRLTDMLYPGMLPWDHRERIDTQTMQSELRAQRAVLNALVYGGALDSRSAQAMASVVAGRSHCMPVVYPLYTVSILSAPPSPPSASMLCYRAGTHLGRSLDRSLC